jgi:hypothetical protein
MAKQRKVSLKVLVDGKRRYISVPTGRAGALHTYLRAHGVTAAPPAPSFTGFDSIELVEGRDITAVQNLLKCWF